jgi:hypothetical protein
MAPAPGSKWWLSLIITGVILVGNKPKVTSWTAVLYGT